MFLNREIKLGLLLQQFHLFLKLLQRFISVLMSLFLQEELMSSNSSHSALQPLMGLPMDISVVLFLQQ